jgi:hypothetical protein
MGWLDRPDGRTSAASNFHNRLRASGPWGRSVRTAKLQHATSISDTRASGPWGGYVRTVEVESAVTIYDAPASGPQLSDVRTVHFELRFLPYGDTRLDGILHRPDGWLIFPFLKLWKESVIRSRTDRRPDVLLKRPNGASLHRSFSIRCRCPDGRSTSSGQVMLVCLMSGRSDTSSRRMNSRQMGVRTGWHIVRTADRELWNSSYFTLKRGIPICRIIYT